MYAGIGAATLTVAAAISLLAGAGPWGAQAPDDVACTVNDVTLSWDTRCGRETNDGDSGGVSGFASVQAERVGGRAELEFRARGEKVQLTADTGSETEFVVYVRRGSRWEPAFTHVESDGHIEKELDLAIPDGLPVWAGVCVDDQQCAGTTTLRS